MTHTTFGCDPISPFTISLPHSCFAPGIYSLVSALGSAAGVTAGASGMSLVVSAAVSFSASDEVQRVYEIG